MGENPRMLRRLFLACVFTALAACSREVPREMPPEPSPPPSAGESPAATLDRIDRREPVPLLPMMALHQKENMRDHLLAVQEIVVALSNEDYAGVEKAARRIGYSETMAQMCTHMGAGAPGFTEQGIAFHRAADGILEAARQGDRQRVLAELGAT